MGQRTRRLIFFVLAILVGLAAGLFYGWEINPVQLSGESPETLRIDFKADVVLMIAELSKAEGDIGETLTRLRFLGDENPVNIVKDAVAFAEQHDYAEKDLELMRGLLAFLEASAEVSY